MATWGGKRVGAGRKPKTCRQEIVTGARSERGRARVLEHPSVLPVMANAVSVDELDASELTPDEHRVWVELAPLAVANRTLTPATALAFRLLCRNLVLERALAADNQTCGGGNHRGLIQRVDVELLSFSLAPCGKPIYEEAPKASPMSALDRFRKVTA